MKTSRTIRSTSNQNARHDAQAVFGKPWATSRGAGAKTLLKSAFSGLRTKGNRCGMEFQDWIFACIFFYALLWLGQYMIDWIVRFGICSRVHHESQCVSPCWFDRMLKCWVGLFSCVNGEVQHVYLIPPLMNQPSVTSMIPQSYHSQVTRVNHPEPVRDFICGRDQWYIPLPHFFPHGFLCYAWPYQYISPVLRKLYH